MKESHTCLSKRWKITINVFKAKIGQQIFIIGPSAAGGFSLYHMSKLRPTVFLCNCWPTLFQPGFAFQGKCAAREMCRVTIAAHFHSRGNKQVENVKPSAGDVIVLLKLGPAWKPSVSKLQ